MIVVIIYECLGNIVVDSSIIGIIYVLHGVIVPGIVGAVAEILAIVAFFSLFLGFNLCEVIVVRRPCHAVFADKIVVIKGSCEFIEGIADLIWFASLALVKRRAETDSGGKCQGIDRILRVFYGGIVIVEICRVVFI